MAGPPSLVNASGAELPSSGGGEMATYLDELLRSPGELLEQRRLERIRREKARGELSESVKTKMAFAQIAFEMTFEAFYRPEEDWLIPLRLRIPVEHLKEDRIDIYAALYDKEGRLFDEFIDSVNFDPQYVRESGGDSVHYYNSFSAPSGKYLLKVVFRELNSQTAGYQEKEVVLVESRPEKVNIASILLTNRVEVLPAEIEDLELAATAGSTANEIVFNKARLLPNPSQRFRPEDYLVLYMQLWAPEGARKISVNANFIREGQIVKRLEPRFLENPGLACQEYGTAIPLKDFEPGDYIVQIQAVDHTKRAFDIQRARFAVLAPILQITQPEEVATDQ